MLLKILCFIFIISGAIMVFGARWFVNKYRLDEKTKCEFEGEMSEEELQNYKMSKAVINFKLLGMAVMLPGFIIFLTVFR